MDPITLAVMGGSTLLQNLSARDQKSKQGLANAEMMRYSPWTNLGAQAAKGAQEVNAMDPNKELVQGATNIWGTLKGQEAANELAMKQDKINERLLSAYERQHPTTGDTPMSSPSPQSPSMIAPAIPTNQPIEFWNTFYAQNQRR